MDDLLIVAERRGEIISALFRLAIAAALAALVFTADRQGHPHYPLLVLAGYSLLSAATLLLALRRFFHPALPGALVTIDFTVLAGVMMAVSWVMGIRPDLIWTLPIFSFSLVLLIHASLRYRPWLVLYGAGLLVAGLIAIERLPRSPDGVGMVREAPVSIPAPFGHGGGRDNLRAAPFVLVGLAALLLFYGGLHTRRLLRAAVTEGERVARLSRFFSPEIARRLADAEPGEALGARRMMAAVMFLDIRGFTRLAESVSPERLGELLVDFRARVADAVFAHGGTIDKFLGDGVLAVFGTPEPRPDDAARALHAASALLDAVADWALEYRPEGGAAVGIGIHYGEVFAGVVGQAGLLEHTVIGDTVNVAERLERLTREFSVSLVISGDLARAAGIAASDPGWRWLGPQPVKGHAAPVEVLCRSG